MKTLAVGDFKSKFSAVLDEIRHGGEMTITFGKKKEAVAVIVPYAKYRAQHPRVLGSLAHSGRLVFKKGFKMTESEFLES